jgi:tRNA1(Val) A37 N6-methylase TrmN6
MILLIILLITGCFAAVTLVGAPYLPSFSADVEKLFDKAGLKKGDRLIELGCGDGKVLIAAARRGVKSVGYELNPIIALVVTAS